VKRALTILKARASALEPTVREFKIQRDGIVLGDELEFGRDIVDLSAGALSRAPDRSQDEAR
jgi:hypothetical protein